MVYLFLTFRCLSKQKSGSSCSRSKTRAKEARFANLDGFCASPQSRAWDGRKQYVFAAYSHRMQWSRTTITATEIDNAVRTCGLGSNHDSVTRTEFPAVTVRFSQRMATTVPLARMAGSAPASDNRTHPEAALIAEEGLEQRVTRTG